MFCTKRLSEHWWRFCRCTKHLSEHLLFFVARSVWVNIAWCLMMWTLFLDLTEHFRQRHRNTAMLLHAACSLDSILWNILELEELDDDDAKNPKPLMRLNHGFDELQKCVCVCMHA